MDIRKIRYFLDLAETLNFSASAQRLGISQPALSKAIQRLESEFGGDLFRRAGRNSTLTRFGTALVPELQQLVHSANAAQRAIQKSKEQQRNVVTLGVTCTLQSAHISPFLEQVMAAHPDLTIQLFHGSIGELEEMLHMEFIDAAILAYPVDQPPPYSLIALFSEEIVLSAAVSHKSAARDQLSARDVSNQRYLARDSCEMQSDIVEHMKGLGAPLMPKLSSSDDAMIVSLVGSGAGVSFMPRLTCDAAGLAMVPVKGFMVHRQIAFAEAPGRPRQPGMTQLVAQIRLFDWG